MVSGIVLCAAAVLHPTMLNMIGISANDGRISISNTSMVVILAYLLLVGIPFLIAVARRSNLVYVEPIVASVLASRCRVSCNLERSHSLGLGLPTPSRSGGLCSAL